MQKFLKWYFRISSLLVIGYLLAVVYDILTFKTTGEFRLLPSMNAIKYHTVDEAWAFIESLPTWGYGIPAQRASYVVVIIARINLTAAIIARICKRIDKEQLILVILVFLSVMGMDLIYDISIAGTLSRKYILDTIMR